MLQSWRCFRNAPAIQSGLRRGIADLRPFREGDIVLLRRKDDRAAPPILSRPLKPGRRIESHKGVVRHEDIIGKGVRDLVSALPKRQRAGEEQNGNNREAQQFRLHDVKLDEYVRLTKRLVTPIYPADARLIVDLLDLHPHEALGSHGEDKLEILEAGTGHGALTLYLARAICGANSAISLGARHDADVSVWKHERRAVLHTIEASQKYSQHAENVVAGFKNALYTPHVDFHVGDVGQWITTELGQRAGHPFLSHAFLDLPNADGKLDAVAKALRIDGTLIVFNPSITQIMEAAKKVKDNGIPLDLEKVVELGVNGGSAGREWDVRPVKPRAAQRTALLNSAAIDEDGEVEDSRDDEQVAADGAAPTLKSGWSMVCRPRVGDRVVGGGFLGVWKMQRS